MVSCLGPGKGTPYTPPIQPMQLPLESSSRPGGLLVRDRQGPIPQNQNKSRMANKLGVKMNPKASTKTSRAVEQTFFVALLLEIGHPKEPSRVGSVTSSHICSYSWIVVWSLSEWIQGFGLLTVALRISTQAPTKHHPDQ